MNVDKSHLRVKAASIRFSVTVMSEVSSEKRQTINMYKKTIEVPKWNLEEPLLGFLSSQSSNRQDSHTADVGSSNC